MLVAAMVGIFWYEGSRGVGGGAVRYTVTGWEEASVNGPQKSGTTDEGAESVDSVMVNQTLLSCADFVLVWSDDIGAPDNFEFTVTPPMGEPKGQSAANADGGDGEITVSFCDLNPQPTATSASGDDEADAKRRLGEQVGATGGIGAYNVTVKLTDAGDQSSPVPGLPAGGTADTSQAWQVKVIYHVHDPMLQAS